MIRDTILRQVNQLANAIARALVARKTKDFDQAIAELEEASQQHLGLTLDEILVLPHADLAELVSVDGSVDADLAVSIANMLEERSNITADQSAHESAFLYAAITLLELVRDNPGGLIPLGLDERILSIRQRVTP